MTGIIYSATNLNNGKTYVGKSINSLETRKKNHLKCLKNPKTYFYKALRKYGSENFFWEIIEIINCEDREKLNRILNKYEIYYIKVMDTINSGYNGTHGGTGLQALPGLRGAGDHAGRAERRRFAGRQRDDRHHS